MDLYRKLVVSAAWRKQMPKLAVSLGLSNKIPDNKPGNVAELLERVSQSIKVKHYSEEFLNIAIEADPKLSEAHFHRASILRQLCRQACNMDRAEALVREMEEAGIDAPINIYHTMMDGYTKSI